MIILAGTFRFDADKLETAKPAFEAIVAGSRGEEGCVEYSFGLDAADPGLVNVFELWRDQAALDTHRTTAHMAHWRTLQVGLGMRDRRLAIYEIAKRTVTP